MFALSRTAILSAVMLSLAGVAGAATVRYDVNLEPGWSMVSVPVLPSPVYRPSDFVADAAGLGVTVNVVAKFEQGRWSVFSPSLPFDDNPIAANDAIMVYSAGGTVTLSGEPGIALPTYTPQPTCGPFETPTPTEPPTLTPTLTPADTPTSTPTPTPAPFLGSAGDLYATDSIVGNLRYIPAGTFTQGSPGSEACRLDNETQFTHTLTRDFAMMETEVTRGMWAALLAAQPSLPSDPTDPGRGSGTNNPTQRVTWYEAVLFANLLSVEQGLTRVYYKDAAFTDPVDASDYRSEPFFADFSANGYRLPTEGEWEYAARAGTTAPFSADVSTYNPGSCRDCRAGTHPALEAIAVFCGNDSVASNVVGSKAANPWNLRDMHGNIREWNWDWYDTYPVTSTDYTGAATGASRVFRGGSWTDNPSDVRSADRLWNSAFLRNSDVGFRLARTIP